MPINQPATGFESIQFQTFLNSAIVAQNNTEDWFAGGGAATAYARNWQNAFSGAGAVASYFVSADAPGILRFSTGTTAAGAARVASLFQNALLPAGKASMQWRFRIPALSDGVETFTFRSGLGTPVAASAAAPTDGAWIEYSSAASHAIKLVSAVGNVQTVVNGAALAANTWTVLELRLSANSPRAQLYQNGLLTAELDSGFPASTLPMLIFPGQLAKSAGTTARTLELDMYYYGYAFSSVR
jgi:hypothetical protein